ncbi:MAG: acetylhydrolase [Methylobacterium sp.]|jgi:predicted dienelactone hydrolase|uniref:alpha/beta hydrolase family protein n=1 Tax=unclassified Methylobacterium TaxID=2615210 RepID=UPI0009E79EC5|nr:MULTISPECIES: acetylhydrolase [unclassified Methylobacterium]MDO9427729.1 acetylhydrolase [Methylobacterium sp.]TXM70278.1 acetylhydrolase [Methylobacterium sp. WL69]
MTIIADAPSNSETVLEPATRGPTRRRFGATALAVSASALFLRLPAMALPVTDEARVIDFDWVDLSRARAVPARLYWPAASTQKGTVPLIVFSHGLGGSRKGYSYLGEGWSARGTASLHIQHVGSDETLWQGNPLLLLDRLDGAADEREAIERTRDVSFGLDRLLDQTGPFHAAIDRKRIVAAGHSFGANTTLILTGAQVIRDGKPLGFRDPRFTTSIVISAPPFYGESDLAAVLATVGVPTLHITTTEDTIRIPGRYSPVQDRIDVFNAIPTPQKALVVFQDGSHSVFTDRSLRNGGPLNPLVKRATMEIGLAFLDLVHRSDPAPMDDWNVTWKPILAAAPVPFPPPSRQAVRRRHA